MLDVHVGESRVVAANDVPRFQLDENVHRKIFTSGAFNRSKYPKLLKMRDYYVDIHFVPEELPKLIEEIRALTESLSGDQSVVAALQGFRTICEEALENNQSIFCFSD